MLLQHRDTQIVCSIAGWLFCCLLQSEPMVWSQDENLAASVRLVPDLRGFNGPVQGLAFSPDGTLLVAAGRQEIRLWDIRSGQLLKTLRGEIGSDGYGDCLCAAFSRDGCELVVGIRGEAGTGALRVYDTRDLSQIRELHAGIAAPVVQLAFDLSGRFLIAATSQGGLTAFDWSLRRIVGESDPEATISWDGGNIGFPTAAPVLLIYTADKVQAFSVPGLDPLSPEECLPIDVRDWVEKLKQLRCPAEVKQVQCGWLDGKRACLATGIGDARSRYTRWIGCWQDPASAAATIYDQHQSGITALALSDDATLAASAESRGEIHVWDAQSGELRQRFCSLGQPIFRAAFDAESRRLGFASSALPAAQQGYNRYGSIDRVFDFDRRSVLSSSDSAFPQQNKSTRGYLSTSVRQGVYGLRLSLSRRQAYTCDLDPGFDPTCFRLLGSPLEKVYYPAVVGDVAGRLDCWDLSRRTKIGQLVGHDAFVTSVTESTDGRYLLTSSIDGTIRFWSRTDLARNVGEGSPIQPLLSVIVGRDGQWIIWTPQGYYDAAPGCGDLVGWHVNRGPHASASFFPLHQFRNQLYRPDVVHRVLESASGQVPMAQGDPDESGTPLPMASPLPLATDFRDLQTMQKLQPPRIRILSPQEGAVLTESRVHILAEVMAESELPVTEVRVLVNGRPDLAKGVSVLADESSDPRRISLSRVVQLLPGENQLTVMASNQVAVSVPVTVRVDCDVPADPTDPKPNLHLLSIGISEYAEQELNLRFAHLDAQDFAAAWDCQRGTVYAGLDKQLLINSRATADQIRQAMQQLAAGVHRRDVAVIFISAHGIRDRQLEYYLAPHEIDPDDLSRTGLHFSAVSQLLESLPCKVLLFVDTCHAAGITGAKAIWRDPLYELTSDEYGAIVFSSSLSREISVEDEKWQHGAFTKAILDTFASSQSDLNADGFLSLSELEQSVCDRVEEMTQGQQHPVMKRPATIHNIPFYRLTAR